MHHQEVQEVVSSIAAHLNAEHNFTINIDVNTLAFDHHHLFR